LGKKKYLVGEEKYLIGEEKVPNRGNRQAKKVFIPGKYELKSLIYQGFAF
jgi:hypothetical protein